MKKEIKLIKKLELLLKQLNCRSYLHHFGPKKFKLKHHLFALIMMQVCKFSLRRIENLLKMFGIKVPTFSALCKSRKKIPTIIWNSLIKITAGLGHKLVAIDGTGFSRTNPSYHFVKRIDRKDAIKNYAKMSMLYGVKRRKIVGIHVRIRPAHDLRDVKPLMESCKMQCLLADKAYDAEWLHEICFWKGIQTQIPSKERTKKGFFRKKQKTKFSNEIYHQRSLVEAGFSSVKRKYGGYVAGKSLASITSELSCKAIAHNLKLKD